MKRRMKPREPKARPPMDKKDVLGIEVRQRAANTEMMYKQNSELIDTMRRLGKGSSNMLMRVSMMDDNPIFASSNAGSSNLPASLTTQSFGQSNYPETVIAPNKQQEDLVKGGAGDKVFLVSRGVVPSVVPARYDTKKGVYHPAYPTTMKDSYPDHPKEFSRTIAAKNAGQAQAKLWDEAAQRKKELENELDSLDAAIAKEQGQMINTATRHGLFGRTVAEGPFGGTDGKRNAQKPAGAPELKGLTPVGGTTMKDTYIEHAQRKRMTYKGQKVHGGMQYSLLAPDTDDPDAPISPLPNKKTQTVGPFKDVMVPLNPAGMSKASGSEIAGSAFLWKGVRNQSKNAEEFSWPSDKMIKYDHEKEEVVDKHQYGKYAITQTRYGDCAKECDYGKSVHVKSLKEIRRHLRKCMQ